MVDDRVRCSGVHCILYLAHKRQKPSIKQLRALGSQPTLVFAILPMLRGVFQIAASFALLISNLHCVGGIVVGIVAIHHTCPGDPLGDKDGLLLA